MKEDIKDAVNYALDSNKLEDYHLTNEEVEKVIDTIDKSDKSFTDSVLDMIKEEKKEDNNNVKIRK